MSKYDDYLTEKLQELQELQEEIENLATPTYQLNRMREYYTKNEEVKQYFKSYPDKVSKKKK